MAERKIPTIDDVALIVARHFMALAKQGAPRALCIERALERAEGWEALLKAQSPSHLVH